MYDFNFRTAILIGMFFLAWPFVVSAQDDFWAVPEATQDEKIKKLEDQLKQQQEQNRQILELLKARQGQQEDSDALFDTPSPAQDQNSIPATFTKLTPGWLACIMSTAAKESSKRDKDLLLGEKQGCFIATKDSYDYKEYMKIPGMPREPRAGWKGEAFFETREQGRHTFTISFEAETNDLSPSFDFSSGLKIDDIEIFNEKKEFRRKNLCDASDRKKVCGSFTGGVDLEPGRYKVEFWFYQSTGYYFDKLKKATFFVYTKKPSDRLPVPASKSMLVRSAD